MKKLLCVLGLCCTTAFAFTPPNYTWELLPLVFREPGIRPDKGNPRGPVYIPQVGQDGSTLYFLDEDDFVINLYSVDDDDNFQLEYTDTVAATSGTLTLPTTLTGTYTIEVIRGDQHFWGEIEL